MKLKVLKNIRKGMYVQFDVSGDTVHYNLWHKDSLYLDEALYGIFADCFQKSLDFIDIPEVFDGNVVIIPDESFDYGETRFIVMGILILKSQVGVVAYTERGEDIRILSARKATKNEQIYYFQQISN